MNGPRGDCARVFASDVQMLELAVGLPGPREHFASYTRYYCSSNLQLN